MRFRLSESAEAALAKDESILVLGGPGSGKTTLSLLKAKQLIPELMPGQEVLFLSFSRAAVRQVLIRCKDILIASERRAISVKTYHAFCMEILRAHGRLLTGTQARLFFPGSERIAKAAFVGDWEIERLRLANVEGLYTFDLFATAAAHLVNGSSALAEVIADKYPVVILDEFQDTDDSQWELVRWLSKRSRVIVLADPDQRIFDYDDRVDPRRLDQLREFIHLPEFDLAGENHRSPDAGILKYADALLRNQPRPDTDDVRELSYWQNAFGPIVHAAVVWMFATLRKAGIVDPSIVVLGRTNSFVADLSIALSVEDTYNGQRLRPIDHDILWDAELSAAAAQVVASILEWPQREKSAAVSRSLDRIAFFFETKNSINPSASALAVRDRYRVAAERIRTNRQPRPYGARHIVGSFDAGLSFVGDPACDWTTARGILDIGNELSEVFTSARFVRLFRATDEIGGRLAEEWARSGSYGNASDMVRRTLDMGRLLSDQRETRGCVVMTIHKSKGKEFDAVILVEGKYQAKLLESKSEPPPYWAARRLLRVGVTRARHKVVIIRPQDAAALTD